MADWLVYAWRSKRGCATKADQGVSNLQASPYRLSASTLGAQHRDLSRDQPYLLYWISMRLRTALSQETEGLLSGTVIATCLSARLLLLPTRVTACCADENSSLTNQFIDFSSSARCEWIWRVPPNREQELLLNLALHFLHIARAASLFSPASSLQPIAAFPSQEHKHLFGFIEPAHIVRSIQP